MSEDVFCDLARVKRSGPFLEDCKFFLSGFSPKDSDRFQLSIETAGGSFSNVLTPSVTHMVIRNYVPRHFQLLKDMQISPYKIIPQWLVESMLMGRPIPEEVHKYFYIIQILREINYELFKVVEISVFVLLGALKFVDSVNYSLE